MLLFIIVIDVCFLGMSGRRITTRSKEKGTSQSLATIRSDSEAVPVPPVLPGPRSGQPMFKVGNF